MSSDTPSLPTRDELLAFVEEEVARHGGKRVNGAQLNLAVNLHFPGVVFPCAQLGFERLADVVRVAEEQGRLFRHRDVIHLEVSTTPSTPRVLPKSGGRRQSQTRIRPELWDGFLFVHRGLTNFFDCQTGQVVPARESTSADYRQNQRYIQLHPIPADVQREWMHQFCADHPIVASVAALIDGDGGDWQPKRFWLELQDIGQEFAAEWSRFRTKCTIAYISKWATDNKISYDLVFSSGPGPFGGLPTPGVPAVTPLPAKGVDEDEALRAALLNALGEMTLDELFNLFPPLRKLVRHLRPR